MWAREPSESWLQKNCKLWCRPVWTQRRKCCCLYSARTTTIWVVRSPVGRFASATKVRGTQKTNFLTKFARNGPHFHNLRIALADDIRTISIVAITNSHKVVQKKHRQTVAFCLRTLFSLKHRPKQSVVGPVPSELMQPWRTTSYKSTGLFGTRRSGAGSMDPAHDPHANNMFCKVLLGLPNVARHAWVNTRT
jgi:hypothetical protein